MISCDNVVDIIKLCIPKTHTNLTQQEFEQLKTNIILTKYIIDKQIENKHIIKTKSLQNLNSNFKNETYIKRSLSEPKKIRHMNIKIYNS